LIVNDNSDILLTFSWGNFSHGVSGHLFECIDYYLLLKEYFKVKILIPEKIEKYKEIIEDKYRLSKDEIQDILDNTMQIIKPTLVKSNIIFFTDGSYKNIQRLNLVYNKIICFACGDFTLLDNDKKNLYVLLDKRVYSKIPKDSFDYKKKLFFGKYKKDVEKGDKTLIYATENCRKTDKELPNQLKLTKKDLPYLGLFNEFNTYYYTPVPRKFDCSPRLLAECKFYKKKVIFDEEVLDYFEEDKGLYWRWYDIQNDFESLFLTYDDEIVRIIKDICELQ
jgi:hypothetical protein